MKTEFTVQGQLLTNKDSAIKWLISHARHHLWAVFGMIIPSFANAALAAMVPLLIGIAFETLVQGMPQPDYKHLLWASTMIVLLPLGSVMF